MIIKEGTEIGNYAEIRSATDEIVQRVKSFDTVTKKAVLYATIGYANSDRRGVAMLGADLRSKDRKTVTFTCHLLGHRAYDRRTGKEIK